MKKFNRIWMWMAIAATSFSFTSCDDDDYWHDDYYWYDDYNHGGWGWNQGDWNNGSNGSQDDEPGNYVEDILDVELLIIDDLGTEFTTVFSSSELFNIINSRLISKKPVIISTNLGLKDLTEKYSDRITSRLMGSFTTLKFFGEDIRLLKKFRK